MAQQVKASAQAIAKAQAQAKAKVQALENTKRKQEAIIKANSTENMTSKQLTTWQKATTQSLNRLAKQLERMYGFAFKLKTITSSGQDENNLSYRYNDLASCLSTSAKKVSTFATEFDSSLTAYIKKVSKDEAEVVEKARRNIDNFKEVANKISKLKM